MTPEQAIQTALAYAISLGAGSIRTAGIKRFPEWWVVGFKSLDVPFVIVEDNGRTHVETMPIGRWFEGEVTAPTPEGVYPDVGKSD